MQGNKSWEFCGLDDWIKKQCISLGIVTPSLVQQHCIPQILNGKDCIGCAKTGSGKTLAFAIPILQKLYEDPFGIFALVLTPTRELAFQIADQFQLLGKVVGLKVAVITGGMDMMIQSQQLSLTPHIVIATPGRLVDHLQSCKTFSLQKVRFLVLDEADRLLEGHFDVQLSVIFNCLPTSRQTLLFSATITDPLIHLKKLIGSDPFYWEASDTSITVPQLNQHFVLCPADVKDGYLVHLIQEFYEHDNKGLDIPAVNLVLNYNVPKVPKDYVHRVGRTARAGRSGTAITLVTQNDVALLHAIEELTGTQMNPYSVNEKEILRILTQVAVSRSECEIQLDLEKFDEAKIINKRKKAILEGQHPDSVHRCKKRSKNKLRPK